MRLLLIITFLIATAPYLKAQDTLSYEVFKQKALETKVLIPDTVNTTVDSTKRITDTRINKPAIPIPATNRKRLFELPDDTLAAAIDEKWREELAKNDLYDSITAMRRSVLKDLPADDVDLPTEVLKERLAQIDARTPFNVAYNHSLESVIKRYLKRNKPALQRLMAQSAYYFPMFEDMLAKYDIPLEMKYLAIVESALRPRARSRVGATGMWQFMFSTGKLYDLEVNSYVDDRMDPIKSTEAACQYLSKLYDIFNDWDLALAAYNSGPGNVTKAIRRSGGYKNYWNIRNNLPRETAGYVPSFLATMYLFEYAEAHGFIAEAPQTTYYATDTIHIKQLITFKQIEKKTGVSLEELQYLNPQYKLDIIPVVKGKTYYLRLPQEAVGAFVNNEDAIYAFAKAELDKREKPLPELTKAGSQIRYRVRSGDYLGKIAKKYGVRISQIKKWNNMRSDNLKVGQRLTIYPRRM